MLRAGQAAPGIIPAAPPQTAAHPFVAALCVLRPDAGPWQRYLAIMRFPGPRYRGIAPLTAAGAEMSSSEYEEWRDAHTWDPSRGTRLVIEADLTPAAWIEPLLLGHWSAHLAMLPGGFEAYARLYFPFAGEDGPQHPNRIADALTEPESIILSGPDGHAEPEAYCGFLPQGELNALLPTLARYTSSADSWFLLWEGFGNLSERAFSKAPKVLYLLNGPHSACAAIPFEPNYWWPSDRVWCVCADTDWDYVYIAGPAICIDEIIRASGQ